MRHPWILEQLLQGWQPKVGIQHYKTPATEYPVRYRKRKPNGSPRRPNSDISLGALTGRTLREDWEARPVVSQDRLSPWITGPRPIVEALQRVVGQSPYRVSAREGSNTRMTCCGTTKSCRRTTTLKLNLTRTRLRPTLPIRRA